MQPRDLLQQFGEAVAATDGERVAALFAESGVYHDQVYGPCKGRASIRELFRRVNESGCDYRFDMEDIVCSDSEGYMRYRFSFTTKGEPFDGRRVAIEGVGHFAFENGLIGHYHETANQGLSLVQLGMAPEQIERVLKRWAKDLLGKPQMKRHL